LAAFHSAKSSGSRFSPVWPWADRRSEARRRSGSWPDRAPYPSTVRTDEVDVAAGDVRVAALEDPLDERDDARQAAGDAAARRRRQHLHAVVGLRERAGHAGGERPPRLVVVARVVDDLVVDVGDVADEHDPLPALEQPPVQDVERHGAAQVADVRPGLHGRAADVDADRAGLQRLSGRTARARVSYRRRLMRSQATGRACRALLRGDDERGRDRRQPLAATGQPSPSVVVALRLTGRRARRRGPPRPRPGAHRAGGAFPTTCTATLPMT
jgi:hypothetical protein